VAYDVCPQCGFASLFVVCSQCGVDRRDPPTPPDLDVLREWKGKHVAVDHKGNVLDGDDILGTLMARLSAANVYPTTILQVPDDDSIDELLAALPAEPAAP
jgi:hypothetical protein